MIYNNFKSVEDSYNYAFKKSQEVYKDAERYIKSVIREAGTLEVTIDDKPTIITLKGKPFEDEEHVVFYQNTMTPFRMYDFSIGEVCNICRSIHSLHLVEEYGDEPEEKEKEETQEQN